MARMQDNELLHTLQEGFKYIETESVVVKLVCANEGMDGFATSYSSLVFWGLRSTRWTRCQLRVRPDQRVGFLALANA